MHIRAVSILFFFVSFCLNAQNGIIHTGLGVYDFNSKILNNNGFLNNQLGAEIYMGYEKVPKKFIGFNTQFSAGFLQNLGPKYKPYTTGNFARLDFGITFQLKKIVTKNQKKLRIPLTAGYGFSYIPKHAEVGYQKVSTSIYSGIGVNWNAFKNIWICANANYNQRLGADFRSFIKYQFGLILPL